MKEDREKKADAVIGTILHRRSIRRFDSRQIEENILQKILI